jgi:hypothetical protein
MASRDRPVAVPGRGRLQTGWADPMRMMMIFLCAGLAGCAAGGPGGEPSLASMEAPAAAAANEPATPPRGRPRHVAAARAEPAAAPDPVDDGPMTHQKASALCWMKYEDGKVQLSLDKRADLVNQCVAETLRGGPAR